MNSTLSASRETELIHKQIILVTGDIGIIAKTGKNPQGWAFRKVDDIKDAMNPYLVKHGVYIVPKVLSDRESIITNNNKTQIRTVVRVEYTIGCADGSNLVAVTIGEGADYSDKSCAKAMTAAYKTMLDEVFCIALNTPEADDDDIPSAAPKKNVESKKPTYVNVRGGVAPEYDDFVGADVGHPKDYVPLVGKFKGIALGDIEPGELKKYMKETLGPGLLQRKKDVADGKKVNPLSDQWNEFLDVATCFLDNEDRSGFESYP